MLYVDDESRADGNGKYDECCSPAPVTGVPQVDSIADDNDGGEGYV